MPSYTYRCCDSCNAPDVIRISSVDDRDKQLCEICRRRMVRLLASDAPTCAIHTPFGYLETKHRDDPDAASMIPMTDYQVREMRERAHYKHEQHRKLDQSKGRCPQ
jgi:predicted nucleic acid-binding Zn ribbon protein